MQQVAAIYVHVALTCTAPLCGKPWGRASVPPVGVDAPSGQMQQVAACLISHQYRLQVEEPEMVAGAGVWRERPMQGDNT